MNILALVHGLWLGGAQISTLEQLELLKKEEKADIEVVICYGANKEFINRLSLVAHIHEVPCTKGMRYPIMNVKEVDRYYPIMDVKEVYRYVERTDIIWITDIEYLSVPHIKRIKNKPIVAHLRSYALICPWWVALYGFREPCLEKCSAWRSTRCKQGVNLELAKIGLLSSARARLYWLRDFIKGPLDFFKWSRLMNSVAESIDGFIAVSKALQEIHVRHLPSLGSKPFSIVYNPVTEPLKYVKLDPHEPYGDYVLYASGSNPDKGPHLLLEAWQEVSREFVNLKLYMVGCGGSWVERLAKRMGLRNVIFFGKLPPGEYYRLMYRARAVVMPSIWPEPFGRISVEANRLGVPAVVSSSGGLPETIVDEFTGYVFKSGDASDLANKISKAIERDFDRNNIIRYSYERINPQKEVEKLIKFFEEMIENGKS
jgi:glycosyltransferase involved in cell wall biosynthesis